MGDIAAVGVEVVCIAVGAAIGGVDGLCAEGFEPGGCGGGEVDVGLSVWGGGVDVCGVEVFCNVGADLEVSGADGGADGGEEGCIELLRGVFDNACDEAAPARVDGGDFFPIQRRQQDRDAVGGDDARGEACMIEHDGVGFVGRVARGGAVAWTCDIVAVDLFDGDPFALIEPEPARDCVAVAGAGAKGVRHAQRVEQRGLVGDCVLEGCADQHGAR